MNTLDQAKRRMQALGTILALLLVVAGVSPVGAQEMYKLSGDLYRASGIPHNVSMDGTPTFPQREALRQSTVAPDLQASMLEYPVLPESGVAKETAKETRESVLEQIAALGGTFGKGLKAASSRCTGWQNGGFDQPWMAGSDSTVERACIFQFELPTN